jgi:hypothetical protein
MWHNNTCDHVPTDGGCHVGGSAHEPTDVLAGGGMTRKGGRNQDASQISERPAPPAAMRASEPIDCKNHIAADCPTCKEIWRQHAQNR